MKAPLITADKAIRLIAKENAAMTFALQIGLFIEAADNPHIRLETLSEPDDVEMLELAALSQGAIIGLRNLAVSLARRCGKDLGRELVRVKGYMMIEDEGQYETATAKTPAR